MLNTSRVKPCSRKAEPVNGMIAAWSRWMNDRFDKRARGRLLLRQGALFGSAYVNQKSDGQRPISLSLKSENFLRHTIFCQTQIFLAESGDESFLFIGRREKEVGEIGFDPNDFVVLIGLAFAQKLCSSETTTEARRELSEER